MKGLSCHSSLFTDYSIEKTVEILSELGYEAIELNLETAPHFNAHVTPDVGVRRRKEIRKVIESSGLVLSSLSAHNNPVPRQPDLRRKSRDFIKGAIELAGDLGTDIVHLATGVKEFPPGPRDYWRWLVEALIEFVDYGRKNGIRIGVEAGGFPGLLVYNLETVERLLKEVGCDDLYINFDPSHYHISGDCVTRAFRHLSKQVIHIHAKDAKGDREDFEFPPLGKGEIDFEAFIEAVLKSGYNGYISVEYEGQIWGYEDEPVRVARQSKAFLDKILLQ